MVFYWYFNEITISLVSLEILEQQIPTNIDERILLPPMVFFIIFYYIKGKNYE
ncbi:hypothetical protein R84B8_02127 [Treponema sp. R8-4-B8]